MKPRLVDAAGLALGYKPEKPRIKRLNGGAERDRTVGLLNAIYIHGPPLSHLLTPNACYC